MNVAQKWIIIGCSCALGFTAIFPGWHQTFQGPAFPYKQDLGHHLLWAPPLPTGDKKIAPASEWKITIDWSGLSWQGGCIVAMGAILCFTFRKVLLSVTYRALILPSVFLALCLRPAPPADLPLLVWATIAVIGLFVDTGHVGVRDISYMLGKFLPLYTAGAFALFSGALWIARRYARNSTNSRDQGRYALEP